MPRQLERSLQGHLEIFPAVECKLSSAPEASRGFWTALEDLGIEEAWIIAPVKDSYPIKKRVKATPLSGGLRSMANFLHSSHPVQDTAAN